MLPETALPARVRQIVAAVVLALALTAGLVLYAAPTGAFGPSTARHAAQVVAGDSNVVCLLFGRLLRICRR